MTPKHFQWPPQIEPPILYANRQWAVTKFGLECLTDDYPIKAERLGKTTNRSGEILADWVVHMAEKSWVDLDELVDAYAKALKIHKSAYKGMITPKMMERSIEYAKDHSLR
jgi:hypothetical protein